MSCQRSVESVAKSFADAVAVVAVAAAVEPLDFAATKVSWSAVVVAAAVSASSGRPQASLVAVVLAWPVAFAAVCHRCQVAVALACNSYLEMRRIHRFYGFN